MTRYFTILALALAVCLGGFANQAEAGRRKKASAWGYRFAQTRPWHGDYYHTATGGPVSLVVPPTAHMQTFYGWGVAQSGMRPIYHQFARPYPGDYEVTPGQFSPTPHWPSHTDQFGVYYVRGPWGATAPRGARHR